MINDKQLSNLKTAVRAYIYLWIVVSQVLAVLYLANFGIKVEPKVNVVEVTTPVVATAAEK